MTLIQLMQPHNDLEGVDIPSQHHQKRVSNFGHTERQNPSSLRDRRKQ